MDDFIEDCKRTESVLNGLQLSAESTRLLHAAFGMSTEAGEFLDQLKKHYFYGRPLDITNLLEEIGDMMWYQAIALDVLSSTFSDEAARVINKLRVRFPDKFNTVDANLRDLAAEREALERG